MTDTVTVYALRFGQGGQFYAIVDDEMGAGPVVYENPEHAEAMAEAIGAEVIERTLRHMILLANEAGWVLWIRRGNGTLVAEPETVELPGKALPAPAKTGRHGRKEPGKGKGTRTREETS